ncbi:Vacuolar protein sorting-associated protein 8 [Grifola frondosa]|uniref:Vacuolar protein sorting-associated protein 8 n=1 Tax=Grifola frondosa TaxID=5627 RepID=A0A1C7M2Y7_GRIFR|nr:Vacuolar protein sorting-associated protein 8 [Grifola frondosa]
MNGTEQTAHDGLAEHLDFSDIEGDEAHDDHPGDYSTRFDELMSDGEDIDGHGEGHTEDDEEEGFLYTGVDSEPAGGYREQLRDVLGPDHEDDEVDERHPERSLVHEVAENEKFAALIEDEAGHVEVLSDRSPSTSSVSPTGLSSPPNMTSNLDGSNTPSKLSRPFLHPTISRLRSATPQPQPSRVPSAASAATMNSHMQEGGSAALSHFSALSRSSSVTNVSGLEQANVSNGHQAREVFRWTQLRSIRELLYTNHPSKASTVLGSQSTGSPTVLAANGLICVGTDIGRILVFDFKQNLKCVCGTETPDKAVGPVTALALSFDHTYVAAGHTSGHIQLFDLRTPKAPVRFVPPTTLAAVASGRQEGHLVGSRIVSIGFIAGRHTALVSADDSGLAFYHSLGKVLTSSFPSSKSRKPSTILAMAPLPFGTASHSTDSYHLIALLTPIKLVIVGLKPSPKTWYRRHREVEEAGGSKAKFKGALAWFPSVVPGMARWQVRNGVARRMAFFTLRRSPCWFTLGAWLNVNQIVVLTPAAFEVYDVHSLKLVERESFDGGPWSPHILYNGTISYSDAITEVAHSVRVYKGKIFLLGQHEIQVGTLLTWADRILSFVQNGDF